MKNIVLLVIFVLGIVLFQYIQSHSVDEIIRKYLDARGGKQKLNAIRSVYMEGSRIIMGTQIPVKVTINEYLEISKEFSTPKSNSFINGILDKILADLKAQNKVKKIGRGLIEE